MSIMIIKIILCGQNIAQNIADIEHFSLLQGVAFETQRLRANLYDSSRESPLVFKISTRISNEEQRVFITGGAGTGISHVISFI